MPRTWCCPFWKFEDGLKVFCEGCRLHFQAAEARNDYVSRFCANVPGWEDCTVAQELILQEEKREQEKPSKRPRR